jgi:hypothetical protein
MLQKGGIIENLLPCNMFNVLRSPEPSLKLIHPDISFLSDNIEFIGRTKERLARITGLTDLFINLPDIDPFERLYGAFDGAETRREEAIRLRKN